MFVSFPSCVYAVGLFICALVSILSFLRWCDLSLDSSRLSWPFFILFVFSYGSFWLLFFYLRFNFYG